MKIPARRMTTVPRTKTGETIVIDVLSLGRSDAPKPLSYIHFHQGQEFCYILLFGASSLPMGDSGMQQVGKEWGTNARTPHHTASIVDSSTVAMQAVAQTDIRLG